MSWRCLYTPLARGYDVRAVLPGNRRALPSEINLHSVKNRFLTRIKNMTPDLYRRNWVSITSRDLVVICACVVREHSLLRAFWFLAKHLKSVQAKRKEIMRRRAKDDYISSWLSYEPVSRPAPKAHADASPSLPRRPRLAISAS
jgi:hypothetical protein